MGAQEVEEEFRDVPREIGLIVEITVRLQVVLVNDCKVIIIALCKQYQQTLELNSEVF